VETGCADPDPWRGFCSVIEEIGVLNARNQGFVDAFTTAHPDAGAFVGHRADLLGQLAELTRRAVQAGGLRRDFVLDDLVLVLVAGRGLRSVSHAGREAAARRFASLAIDAFRSSDMHRVSTAAGRGVGHLLAVDQLR
jgi:hypothetical protein